MNKHQHVKFLKSENNVLNFIKNYNYLSFGIIFGIIRHHISNKFSSVNTITWKSIIYTRPIIYSIFINEKNSNICNKKIDHLFKNILTLDI